MKGKAKRMGHEIVIAPNAFKGSLSAPLVAQAIARGVSAVLPDWVLWQVPLADGGDGTVECVVKATGGRLFEKVVTGPLGERIKAYWGLTGDGKMAVVETAAASGLALISRERRDPFAATSYGTGELLREALESGCRTIFLGLGGSATNDAGAGILQALGVKLLNNKGEEIERGAAGLAALEKIDPAPAHPKLGEVELILGCDVDNPLYGPTGAAYVYAPQKGALPEQLPVLDDLLKRFAAVVQKDCGRDISTLPGGGAAGGIAAGLAGVVGARLVNGMEMIARLTGLEERLARKEVKLVITGEGEINTQSLRGKVPIGVARLASRHRKPVVILAGSIKVGLEEAQKEGVTTMFCIADGPLSLAESMARTPELLEDTARRVMSMYKALNL